MKATTVSKFKKHDSRRDFILSQFVNTLDEHFDENSGLVINHGQVEGIEYITEE